MPEKLELTLLGHIEIRREGLLAADFSAGKTLALLYYLAVTGRSHTRSSLAGLLWGGMPEARARGNLSKALSTLRQLFGDYLIITRQTVAFKRESDYRLDVAAFERLLETGDLRFPASNRQSPPSANLQSLISNLQQAVELYRGDFLEGFFIRNAPEFETWVLTQRARLKELALQALHTLTAHFAEQGEAGRATAIAYTTRLLALEPWREEAHRQLMSLLALSGKRGAALAQYETCRQVLAEELGVEPGGETTALYERIRDGKLSGGAGERGSRGDFSLAPPLPTPLRPGTISPEEQTFVTGPPISKPHQFYGRTREVNRIFGWWGRLPMTHITILGARRSGKTSLLHYLRKITVTPPHRLRPGQKHDWLPDPGHYRWVWVDFQDPRMRVQKMLLHRLLNGFGCQNAAPCSLEQFMNLAVDLEWDRPTIVLMDELGAGLAAPELDQSFWWALRSLVSGVSDGKLAFLLAAHNNPAQLAEEQGKASPFFNIFTTLELGPFTDIEARELVAASPLPFTADDVAWLLARSKRWPCALQVLCQERLMALEAGEGGDGWKQAGLQRIQLFRYLIEANYA